MVLFSKSLMSADPSKLEPYFSRIRFTKRKRNIGSTIVKVSCLDLALASTSFREFHS